MQKKNEERDDLCYNCKKPEHFRDECPDPPARKYNDDERRQRRDRREKTRAFVAETEKGKKKACVEEMTLQISAALTVTHQNQTTRH